MQGKGWEMWYKDPGLKVGNSKRGDNYNCTDFPRNKTTKPHIGPQHWGDEPHNIWLSKSTKAYFGRAREWLKKLHS